MSRRVAFEPLTQSAFSSFGDVIEAAGEFRLVNQKTSMRFDDLARIDVNEAGGRPMVSLFRAQPRSLPLSIELLERHPLSSQAFFPVGGARFLIVVAPAGDVAAIRAFLSNGAQGVNYHRGVWHHPLIALDRESDVLVVDRGGEGDDYEEHRFDEDQRPLVGAASGRDSLS